MSRSRTTSILGLALSSSMRFTVGVLGLGLAFSAAISVERHALATKHREKGGRTRLLKQYIVGAAVGMGSPSRVQSLALPGGGWQVTSSDLASRSKTTWTFDKNSLTIEAHPRKGGPRKIVVSIEPDSPVLEGRLKAFQRGSSTSPGKISLRFGTKGVESTRLPGRRVEEAMRDIGVLTNGVVHPSGPQDYRVDLFATRDNLREAVKRGMPLGPELVSAYSAGVRHSVEGLTHELNLKLIKIMEEAGIVASYGPGGVALEPTRPQIEMMHDIAAKFGVTAREGPTFREGSAPWLGSSGHSQNKVSKAEKPVANAGDRHAEDEESPAKNPLGPDGPGDSHLLAMAAHAMAAMAPVKESWPPRTRALAKLEAGYTKLANEKYRLFVEEHRDEPPENATKWAAAYRILRVKDGGTIEGRTRAQLAQDDAPLLRQPPFQLTAEEIAALSTD